MIKEFSAVEASSINDFDTVTTGVYDGNEEYICFQRHEEHGHEDDDGIYIEYKDQLHAGENIVEKVILSNDKLTINLSSPLFKLDDISGFEVTLNLSQKDFSTLKNGLEFTFWDCLDRLQTNA